MEIWNLKGYNSQRWENWKKMKEDEYATASLHQVHHLDELVHEIEKRTQTVEWVRMFECTQSKNWNQSYLWEHSNKRPTEKERKKNKPTTNEHNHWWFIKFLIFQKKKTPLNTLGPETESSGAGCSWIHKYENRKSSVTAIRKSRTKEKCSKMWYNLKQILTFDERGFHSPH